MDFLRFFRRRRSAYKELLDPVDKRAEIILADLKRYCRGGVTTFSKDPYEAAFLAGRQDVFNRIVNFTNLTNEQIAKLQEEQG